MAFDPVATTIDEAQKQGVDPQLALNVLWQESHKNMGATSSKGAKGYFQLMPAAASDMGVDRNDPESNVRGGVRYLAQQIKRFGSNELGVAAYNAGPEAVAKYGGIPPYKETQAYVSSVIPSAASTPLAGGAGNDKLAPDLGYDPTIFTPSAKPAQGQAPDLGYDPAIFGGRPASAPSTAPAAAPVNTAQTGDLPYGDPADENLQSGTYRDPRTGKVFTQVNVGGEPTKPSAPLAPPMAPGLQTALADEQAKQAALAKASPRIPFLSDFSDSVTAPLNDKIAGAIGGIKQGLYNVGASALGQPVNVSPGQRYEAAAMTERAAQADRDKTDPIASYGGQILGGAAMLPAAAEGAAVAAPSILKTLATNAGVGAGLGAVSAPGDDISNPNDWASRAKGAAWGAGLGVAAPVALGVAAKAAQPLLAPLGTLAGRIGDAIMPTTASTAAQAADRIGATPVNNFIQKWNPLQAPGALVDRVFGPSPRLPGQTGDVAADFAAQFPQTAPSSASPNTSQQAADYVAGLVNAARKDPYGTPLPARLDLSSLAGATQPTAAEALGMTGINSAAAIARKAGTTGDAAQAVFGDRIASRPLNTLNAFQNITGVDPASTRGDIDAIVSGGRASAAPLYADLNADPTLYSSGATSNVLAAPAGQQAARDLWTNTLNDPATPHPTALGLAQGNFGQITAPNGLTAQGWDLFKKNLNGQVSRDGFGRPIPDSQDMGNQAVNSLNKYLTGDPTGGLRTIVPNYADALDASGDYLSQKQAYDNAKGMLFNRSVAPQDVTSLMGTNAQSAAMKAAFGNDIFMRAQNGQLRAGDLSNPNIQGKLSALFGNDQAGQLSDFADQQAAMLPAERLVPPQNGSQTFTLGQANTAQPTGLDGAKIAADIGTGIVMGKSPPHAILGGLVKNLSGAYDPATNTLDAMSVPVRNEVGNILLGSPSDAASYLNSVLGDNSQNAAGSIPLSTAPPPLPYGLFGSGLNSFLTGSGLTN